MKLYLSSNNIPRPAELCKLLGKKPKLVRVALVGNARDAKPVAVRKQRLGSVRAMLKEAGFTRVEEVDLRSYTNAASLFKDLSGYDFVWVAGGNSFVLRKAMQTSGVDKILRRLLAKGIVYGGESAGAAVVGASLRGIELIDDITAVSEPLVEGLKLVDAAIVPHADYEPYRREMKKIIQLNKLAGKRVILLKDSEDYIVSD